ncbi:MAG: D-arabinono-1,4-lactone oxidase [Allobranchiibius sp.]
MAATTDPVGTTWSGTYTFRAAQRVQPTCLDDLARVVSNASAVKVLGSGHSFNSIADSEHGVQVDLSVMVGPPVLSTDRTYVEVDAAMTYGVLVPFLVAADLALANLASLPHITIAGSVATGTHGSGVHQPGLSQAVLAIQLLRGDGSLRWYDRTDPTFDAMVVSLGALGIVTKLRLAVLPTFRICQDTYQGITWSQLIDSLDTVLESAYSVSVFSRWTGQGPDHILCKSRVGAGFSRPALPHTRRVDQTLHPAWVSGESNQKVTEQAGVPGLWSDRLPHFKLGFTPSSGQEIQSEFFVPRAAGPAAVAALREIGHLISPALIISEIRAVAADTQWLSPASKRDSVALHFTWAPNIPAVLSAVDAVQRALSDLDVRPHWGKVFTYPGRLDAHYPRLNDFDALRRRMDPTDKFTNDFIRRHVAVAN